jgi:hypothetical protein
VFSKSELRADERPQLPTFAFDIVSGEMSCVLHDDAIGPSSSSPTHLTAFDQKSPNSIDQLAVR